MQVRTRLQVTSARRMHKTTVLEQNSIHFNMTHYKWKWLWSDFGDEIINSSQQFSSKDSCRADGLKHKPTIRRHDMKGRRGHIKLEITSYIDLEYRFMFAIYNDNSVMVARYIEDRWFETAAECLMASYRATPELFDPAFHWDVEFETREKLA